jgi:hypothetical protein
MATETHFSESGASPPERAKNTRLVNSTAPLFVAQNPFVAAHLLSRGHRRIYSRLRSGWAFESTTALEKDFAWLMADVDRLLKEQK